MGCLTSDMGCLTSGLTDRLIGGLNDGVFPRNDQIERDNVEAIDPTSGLPVEGLALHPPRRVPLHIDYDREVSTYYYLTITLLLLYYYLTIVLLLLHLYLTDVTQITYCLNTFLIFSLIF